MNNDVKEKTIYGLSNVSRIQKILSEMPIEHAINLQEKFNLAIDNLKQIDSARKAKMREEEEIVKKFTSEITSCLTSSENGTLTEKQIELITTALIKKNTSPRKKKPAKYRYVDKATNEERTWTGQGRQPKVISEAIASGTHTLEDFLIKKENS